VVSDKHQIRYTADTSEGTWAAAITQGFKLVLSNSDSPWLFDAEVDPDEVINFWGHHEEVYEEISTLLRANLYEAMVAHEFPLLYETVFWDRPLCHETNDQIELPDLSYKTCLDFQNTDKFQHICEEKRVRELCPVTCDSCTEDSSGHILFKRKLLSCVEVRSNSDQYCNDAKIRTFCAMTCSDEADID